MTETISVVVASLAVVASLWLVWSRLATLEQFWRAQEQIADAERLAAYWHDLAHEFNERVAWLEVEVASHGGRVNVTRVQRDFNAYLASGGGRATQMKGPGAAHVSVPRVPAAYDSEARPCAARVPAAQLVLEPVSAAAASEVPPEAARAA